MNLLSKITYGYYKIRYGSKKYGLSGISDVEKQLKNRHKSKTPHHRSPSEECINQAFSFIGWLKHFGNNECLNDIQLFENGMGGLSFEWISFEKKHYIDINEDGHVHFSQYPQK